MKKLLWILAFCYVFHACSERKETEMDKLEISWDTLALIPPVQGTTIQHGLAGPVAGTYKNFLLIAGGSNFEDAMPWDGGTKSYHDDIFILAKNSNDQFEWSQPNTKLPFSMAYSACISTKKGILSIGGESNNNPISNVFLLTTDGDGKDIQINNFPDLPVSLSSSGAAIIGKTVYLAGGLGSIGATKHFLSLNLSSENPEWKQLTDLPAALSHAVVTSQFDGKEDCIYVLGGRNKSGITSTFLSDIWKYSPTKNEWQKAGVLKVDEKDTFGLSAGTGLAQGKHFILLFGGDNGFIFNQTETFIHAIGQAKTEAERQKLKNQKNHNLINHSGFCREVYQFNTISGELRVIGEIPGYTQVTTRAFWWNDQIIIPGGEVRPGVRSSAVTRGIINTR